MGFHGISWEKVGGQRILSTILSILPLFWLDFENKRETNVLMQRSSTVDGGFAPWDGHDLQTISPIICVRNAVIRCSTIRHPDQRYWNLTGRRFCVRWPVSRVLFPLAREMAIPLGRSLPNASRDLPGRRPETAIAVPIWSCSRWGLPCRLRYRSRGALLPHPFNLARTNRRRFAFCCAFPGVASAGCYPAPCFRGVRTFLPASPLRARQSGHPAI